MTERISIETDACGDIVARVGDRAVARAFRRPRLSGRTVYRLYDLWRGGPCLSSYKDRGKAVAALKVIARARRGGTAKTTEARS